MCTNRLRRVLGALSLFLVAMGHSQSSSAINSAVGAAANSRHVVLCSRAQTATTGFAEIIKRACDDQGVDPALVVSVIMIESRGECGAVSRSGAMGLMQLMPSVCEDFGVSDPFDPEENIRGGTALLARHLKKYRGDLKKVLAAYNAGPLRVDNGTWVRRAETRKYVPAVLAYYHAIHNSGGFAPAYMKSGPMEPTGALTQAPSAPITLDGMIEAIRVAQKAVDSSLEITENGALSDAADVVMTDVLAGVSDRTALNRKAELVLENTSLADRKLYTLCLVTSDASGFSDALNKAGLPRASLVGCAHSSKKGSHYWVLVLAE